MHENGEKRVVPELSKEAKRVFDELPVTRSEAADVLLVLAGIKPATEIMLAVAHRKNEKRIPIHPPRGLIYWNEGPIKGFLRTPISVEEWKTKLTALGLTVLEQHTGRQWEQVEVRDLIISLHPRHAQRLGQIFAQVVEENAHMSEKKKDVISTTSRELGELYGFPQSAVDAFVEGEKMGVLCSDNAKSPVLPIEKEPEGDHMAFGMFRLSKEYWRSEEEEIKRRAVVIREMHPTLYKKATQEHNRMMKKFRARAFRNNLLLKLKRVFLEG